MAAAVRISRLHDDPTKLEQAAAQAVAIDIVLRRDFLPDNPLPPSRDPDAPVADTVMAWESGGSERLFLHDLAGPSDPAAGGKSSSRSAAAASRLPEGSIVAVFDARATRRPRAETEKLVNSFTEQAIFVGVAQLGDGPLIATDGNGRRYRLGFTLINAEGVEKASRGRVRVEVIEGALVSVLFFRSLCSWWCWWWWC